MTNKEALQAVLQVSIPDLSLEKAMADRDILPSEVYDSAMSKDIDLAAIELLQGLLSAPDVSEGGYSIRQRDQKAIEARLLYLARKHNVGEILKQYQPTIGSKSPW